MRKNRINGTQSMNTNPIAQRETGWKYDLPTPNTPPDKRTLKLQTNDHNDIYIEIPRSTTQVRGIVLAGGAAILLYLLFGILPAIYDLLTSPQTIRIEIALAFTAFLPAALYAFSPLVRMDLEMPRDEPIRFNRERQKVYFYEYRYRLFNIFDKKQWGVKPVSYNWSDLTAEVYSIYVPLGYGGLIESIKIAVRDPDTGQIIDRLFFSHGLEFGAERWEAVRHYMQRCDERLLELTPPTYGARQEDHPNPFHRLAPKVKWPTEMDLESRTTPGAEDQL